MFGKMVGNMSNFSQPSSLVYDALGETESSRVYLVKFIKMQKVTTNILAHPELYYGTAG